MCAPARPRFRDGCSVCIADLRMEKNVPVYRGRRRGWRAPGEPFLGMRRKKIKKARRHEVESRPDSIGSGRVERGWANITASSGRSPSGAGELEPQMNTDVRSLPLAAGGNPRTPPNITNRTSPQSPGFPSPITGRPWSPPQPSPKYRTHTVCKPMAERLASMGLPIQWRQAEAGPRPAGPHPRNGRHMICVSRSAWHWPRYTELYNQQIGGGSGPTRSRSRCDAHIILIFAQTSCVTFVPNPFVQIASQRSTRLGIAQPATSEPHSFQTPDRPSATKQRMLSSWLL